MALKVRKRIGNILRVLTIDARRAWLALLPLTVMFLVPGLVTCNGEKHLRYTGLLLQLAGLVVVAIGIANTRRLFGRPTVAQAIGKWLLQLKTAFGPPLIQVSASSTVSVEARAAGSGTLSGALTAQSATIEGRLAELERADQEIRQRLTEVSKHVTTIKSELQATIKREMEQRLQADQKLKRLLEDQAAGGLHLETAGLVWLLVGTFVGGIPSELLWLACMLPCLR